VTGEAMSNEKNTIWEIETYIREGGGQYGDWYVGMADDPLRAVEETFRLHRVQNERFMYIEAESETAAAATVNHFVNCCGTGGRAAETGAHGQPRAIYVYKQT
jgi:hypothetical protein